MQLNYGRRLGRWCLYLTLCALLGLSAATGAGMGAGQQADAQGINGGGGRNIVLVFNNQNGNVQIRGAVQLNRIPAPAVAPVNLAMATSSCVGCQTLAVALQIDLVGRNVQVFGPQNAAIATNGGCTGCITMAYALQAVVQVDDPTKVPPEVDQAVIRIRQQLAGLAASRTPVCVAAAQLQQTVVTEFIRAAQILYGPQLTYAPESLACPSM
jgi:hypothetical protein